MRDPEIIAATAAARAADARLFALEISYRRSAKRMADKGTDLGAEWAALAHLVNGMRHLHRQDGLGLCIQCRTECPCEHWQLLLAVAEAVDI